MKDKPAKNPTIRPTNETYNGFQKAYESLNNGLFKNELPNCLITLQRRNGTYGYFSAERFGREDGSAADEIALNPVHFRNRCIEDILATLVHEMTHLWQYHFGKIGRGRYHNRQWAEKMKEIGLQPTDTGKEDGKETGDKISHFIIPDGRFEQIALRLIARGFSITWMENLRTAQSDKSKGGGENSETGNKSGKRVKYICTDSDCEQKAWAKHEALLICGHHMVPMNPSS